MKSLQVTNLNLTQSSLLIFLSPRCMFWMSIHSWGGSCIKVDGWSSEIEGLGGLGHNVRNLQVGYT